MENTVQKNPTLKYNKITNIIFFVMKMMYTNCRKSVGKKVCKQEENTNYL